MTIISPGYKVTAPGSLMLMGEHAVLAQHPALVYAIDRYMTVLVHQTMPANKIIICSDRFGTLILTTGQPIPEPVAHNFRFVLAVLGHFQREMTTGLRIDIRADFEANVGLGSSAALVVALITALAAVLYPEGHFTKAELVTQAIKVIQRVQGMGSGSDVVASMYGGLRYYCPKTHICTLIDSMVIEKSPPTTIYCGYKTPTPQVVEFVQQKMTFRSKKLHLCYEKMAKTVKDATLALMQHHKKKFYEALCSNNVLMQQLGVIDTTMSRLMNHIAQCYGTQAIKVSGAGLGDCFLAFGALDIDKENVSKRALGACVINANLTRHGTKLTIIDD